MLKGYQASDACYGLKTQKMCKPFHLLASFWWSHQYLYKRCPVFLPFWAPQGHHHGGLTFTNKTPMNAERSSKDTVARFLVLLWISLIWRLPYTKWQHSQSRFQDCQMSAFNKLSQKQSEKLLCSSFIPGNNCCVHYLFQGKTAVSIIYSSEKLLSII